GPVVPGPVVPGPGPGGPVVARPGVVGPGTAAVPRPAGPGRRGPGLAGPGGPGPAVAGHPPTHPDTALPGGTGGGELGPVGRAERAEHGELADQRVAVLDDVDPAARGVERAGTVRRLPGLRRGRGGLGQGVGQVDDPDALTRPDAD